MGGRMKNREELCRDGDHAGLKHRSAGEVTFGALCARRPPTEPDGLARALLEIASPAGQITHGLVQSPRQK
jgi:hypothetical protein